MDKGIKGGKGSKREGEEGKGRRRREKGGEGKRREKGGGVYLVQLCQVIPSLLSMTFPDVASKTIFSE